MKLPKSIEIQKVALVAPIGDTPEQSPFEPAPLLVDPVTGRLLTSSMGGPFEPLPGTVDTLLISEDGTQMTYSKEGTDVLTVYITENGRKISLLPPD